ncbi:MAG: CDP-alcohol phosphatidyltransferase family protein [Nanoarchaeota archaeon]|nr:CDP-alcohol phosphatidyltransferase family protein [Nanoarchaeota archaeon]
MSLANTITLFRLAMAPLIFYLLFQESTLASGIALLLFVAAVLSDVLDGYIARKRNEITRLGSFLDPFADKILLYSLLLAFFLQNLFWFWIIALFLFRDATVIVIRWIASRDAVLIPEEKYRKVRSMSLFGILLSLLLYHFFVYHYTLSGMWVTWVISMMFTLFSIFLSFISIIKHILIYGQGVYNRRKSGKAIPAENILILANKKSSGYHDRYRRRLLRVFAKRRNALLHYLPHTANMFFGISVVVTKIIHIIIAGGDGSFESALNYAPFQKKSLGFFPLGSGNAFYSYFYKGKRFEYLRSRFPFREMELDVLELEWDGKKIQTTFVCVGSDAEVIHYRQPGKLGFLGYLKSSLKVALQVKAQHSFEGSIDRKKFTFENCVNLTLAKIPYYGFNLRSITGIVHPTDKKVYGTAIVNTHAQLWNKPVRVLGLLIAAMNLNRPPLVPLKGKKIVVRSQIPFPVQAGGEFLGYTKEIQVKVVRTQKVLVI